MESQVIYFVTYACPRCKADLEVQHGPWSGWRLCPACGLPALPPELLFGHPATRRRVAGYEVEPEPLIEPSEPKKMEVLEPAPIVLVTPSSGFGALRVFFLVGLVISLFLLLLFYLDQNQEMTGLFGGLSFIFFLLLIRGPGRRSKDVDG